MNNYLSKRGYVIRKELLNSEELTKLKLELYAKPLVDSKFAVSGQQTVNYPVYIETKNKLYIPKMFGIEKYGFPDAVLTNYEGEKWSDDIVFNGNLLERQIEPVNLLLESCESKGGGILSIQTGGGKCNKYDTPILMFDGSIKMVQNIKVGELLMGDDSTPRTVLSLATGQDEMYDIIPVKGEKYTVNQEHILCLKVSGCPTIRKFTNYTEVRYFKYNKYNTKIIDNKDGNIQEFLVNLKQQEIMEIAVKDYINMPIDIKHILKGYRTAIDFTEKLLDFDPYIIGLWLGDRTTSRPEITNQDSILLHYVAHNLPKYNCYLTYNVTYKINGYNKNKTYINPFLNVLKNNNLINDKHIPLIYKCNSSENRLKLLAGLIDSDGSLYNNSFDFIQKSEKLIDDIIYLCRSLGFACYKSQCKKWYMYKGEYIEGDYFRITISGDTERIPTLIKRKQAKPRKHIENVLVTAIKVKHVGRDNYYGFTLDGNCRYVMGDFTVTHNTISALYALSKLKGKTIVIVNKIPLMNQWKSEIKQFLPNAKIGTIQGQNNIEIEGCDIVIAMLQSMARVDYPDLLFNDFKTLVVDECFPYNTNIMIKDSNITIGTLYYMKEKRKELPMVKTFNEITKQFEFKKILNVFRKINDNLIKINFSKMSIKSTENHKYLTTDGWKEAIHLKINDYIISHYDKSTINSVCPVFNSDQYQIIIGSFKYITHLKNGRFILRVIHDKKQEEYCKWKASVFNVNITKTEALTFTTNTFYLMNDLPKTKTTIPQWLLNDLDERGLAIWFMDDGSVNKQSFYSILNTDSFDEDTQKRIVQKLQFMGIQCTYINYKKTYYHIKINLKGTKRLIQLISKYIHKDKVNDICINLPIIYSEYIWNNNYLEYGYSKITKITKNIKNYNNSKFKQNYVFDLEIEDNHNYIVCNHSVKSKVTNKYIENGFIVHNCHNLSSKIFSQVLFKVCCKYTIGLSATPKRSDGCEYVFKWHIGEIVYQSHEKRNGKPPIIRLLKIDTQDYKEISVDNKFTGQKQIQFTSMLSELVEMKKRNLLVVECIKDFIRTDNTRKILVLSDRRTHLQNLHTLLNDDHLVTFTYGLFLGSMKQKDLESSRSSQVILATFAAFSEGVSEKDLDTLILISPKKFIGHLKNSIKNDSGKLEQTVGRIFRKDHLTKNPIILDFQDNFSVYKSQAKSRNVFYKQHFENAIIIDESIDLDQHQSVSVSFIKEKKNKKIQEPLGNIMKFCIIED